MGKGRRQEAEVCLWERREIGGRSSSSSNIRHPRVEWCLHKVCGHCPAYGFSRLSALNSCLSKCHSTLESFSSALCLLFPFCLLPSVFCLLSSHLKWPCTRFPYPNGIALFCLGCNHLVTPVSEDSSNPLQLIQILNDLEVAIISFFKGNG